MKFIFSSPGNVHCINDNHHMNVQSLQIRETGNVPQMSRNVA